MSLSNAQIAELLARRSDDAEGHWVRALRRASRAAYTWEVEAAAVAAAGRPLTELRRVGPGIERVIQGWLEDPPEVPAPPVARRGFVTLAEARSVVADQPDWRADLCGDLQMHTLYSDGREDIASMAAAGMDMGYRYVAITDHSKGLRIARGLDERRLGEQGREIDALNARLSGSRPAFRVLRAVEMNLSPEGAGDMDGQALTRLDLVLGSFHSRLRVTGDQTDRYLRALANPHIDVLGHPRGRIYDSRPGLDADWDRVFEEAARRGVAVEIDCYPDRQDLQVDLAVVARDAGCTFSLGTDAHNVRELGFMDIGIASAVIAGIPKDRILNFSDAGSVNARTRP